MAGLLGLFPRKKTEKDEKKKPKRGRPTKEMQAERRLSKLKDATTELKLIEIEKKKRQLLDGDETKGPITHEQVLRVVAYLKELGLEVRARGGGKPIDEDGIRGILHDIADSRMGESLGRAIAAAVSGQVPSAPADAPKQIETSQTQPSPDHDEGDNVDTSFAIVLELSNKTPEQAADWFLARKEPEAKILLRSFANTPDNELDDVLEDYRTRAPALVAWLRSRRDWSIAMVHAIRVKMPKRQAAASGDVGL